jgi:hypothetical protein
VITITIMNLYIYILLLLFFCIEQCVFYYNIKHLNPDLSEKQKAYILSLKTAILMIVIGLTFNINNIFNLQLDLEFTGILSVLFFTSYLIMDLTIGIFEYKEHIDLLSGYIHHIVYILINGLSIYYGLFDKYLLFMISEIPTVILNLGSISKSYRNDYLFGATFFLTRILFHSYLIYSLADSYLILFFGMLSLGLHLWWFKNWSVKYLLKSKIKTE